MVHIVTDSGADFEPHELKSMNIEHIPTVIIFGDKEYRENVDMDKELFYKLLTTSGHFPRTAQTSPMQYEQMLSRFKAAGDEAVVITLSSGFSSFYQNVVMVKNSLEYDDCYVVDSLSVAGGERILVEHAVKLRDRGKTAAEIAAAINELRGRIELYACVDTLEYVYRGGRISRTAYALGTITNVKPVLYVNHDGGVEIAAKMLGISRGIAYMRDRLSVVEPDPDFPIYVLYTCDHRNANSLAKSLGKAGFDIPGEHMVNVGAAIGSHVGINGCGLVYVAK